MKLIKSLLMVTISTLPYAIQATTYTFTVNNKTAGKFALSTGYTVDIYDTERGSANPLSEVRRNHIAFKPSMIPAHSDIKVTLDTDQKPSPIHFRGEMYVYNNIVTPISIEFINHDINIDDSNQFFAEVPLIDSITGRPYKKFTLEMQGGRWIVY